jgi:Mn-dependent DtxR family transcriptional regulator
MFGLTKPQKRVLYEVHTITQRGEVPTYQAIADIIGYRSKTSVYEIWSKLVERGYGKRIKDRHYTMALTKEGEKYIKRVGGK